MHTRFPTSIPNFRHSRRRRGLAAVAESLTASGVVAGMTAVFKLGRTAIGSGVGAAGAALGAWTRVAVSVALCAVVSLSSGAETTRPADATGMATGRGSDDWYRVEWNGMPAGWAREQADPGPAGTRLRTEMEFRLGRMGSQVVIWSRTEFVPSPEPRIVHAALQGPGDTLHLVCRFDADSLHIDSRLGRSTTRTAIPRSADLLRPDEASALFGPKAAAEPADTLRWRAWTPETGAAASFIAVFEGEESLRSGDRTVLARRWTVQPEGQPALRGTEWRDLDGRLLRSEVASVGLVLRRVPPDSALATFAPPEFFSGTLIPIDPPLDAKRPYARVVYEVHPAAGRDWSPARTPAVSWEPIDGGGLRVEARRLEPTAAAAPPRTSAAPLDGAEVVPRDPSGPDVFDAVLQRALASTLLIEAQDPAIREAAAREAAGVPGGWETAKRLQAFVARTVAQKDLGVLFASAARTLESGRGDCTEHALLLAALCRAQGVPARVAAGLVSLGAAMGYHLWTEVYVDGRWIGLDGALDRSPVDGRYLPLAVSDLADDSVAGLALGVLGAFEGLSIRIVEVELLEPGPSDRP